MWKDSLRGYWETEQDLPRLERSFFTKDGLTLAKALLGKVLVHETDRGRIRGVITEVESYMGIEDKGSHTYGGRRTKRTEPMYHIGGTSYVYFTYGMYHCMNITSGEEGNPQAVLIRSVVAADEASQERMLRLRLQLMTEKAKIRKVAQGELLEAEEILRMEKGVKKHLADGPGKLCIAMGITGADNDVDMVRSSSFYVTEGIEVEPQEIRTGKRIGIAYAEEAADYLWRFYLE